MREFEYERFELVMHKHWRIVGRVVQRYLEKDYAGVEFHRYDVEFADTGGSVMWNTPDSIYTEFELTKIQITNPII